MTGTKIIIIIIQSSVKHDTYTPLNIYMAKIAIITIIMATFDETQYSL